MQFYTSALVYNFIWPSKALGGLAKSDITFVSFEIIHSVSVSHAACCLYDDNCVILERFDNGLGYG